MPADAPVVVITGASAGIGRATARHFAARGWRVALLARGADGLRGAVDEIGAAGGEAMALQVDVADEAAVEAAAAHVEAEWGAIRVWVNNAMATLYCELVDIDPADYRRATEVTYLGTVWGTLAALKRMRARDCGTIVQVGSALAYRSIPLQAPYCGAKAAVRGFTDSLRSELIHAGSRVQVTMVQLSAFNTPQFDWGRNCMARRAQPVPPIFQPEIAARAIYHAALHPRRELWVGWPAVQAIVGTRLIPGFLDWLLARRGYEGQRSDEPLPPERRDNLYSPVPGDHGAHGRFDSRARRASLQLALNLRRGELLAGALAVLAGGALLALRRRR